jgi:hypothetical protein
MNNHSWASAQPPTNNAGPMLRAGLTERVCHRNPHQMDQHQHNFYRDAGETNWSFQISRAKDREYEEKGQHHFGKQTQSSGCSRRGNAFTQVGTPTDFSRLLAIGIWASILDEPSKSILRGLWSRKRIL